MDERLDPEPAREDWAGQDEALGELRDAAARVLVAAAEPDAELAHLLGRAAAVLHAAGDLDGSDELLGRAAALAPEGTPRALLVAGAREPRAFTRLARARWLAARGDLGGARAVLSDASKLARSPLLRDEIGALRLTLGVSPATARRARRIVLVLALAVAGSLGAGAVLVFRKPPPVPPGTLGDEPLETVVAAAVLGLDLGGVPRPLTRLKLEWAVAAISRFHRLPDAVRARLAPTMIAEAWRWADELGTSSEGLGDALRLLDLLRASGVRDSRIERRRAALARRLAVSVAGDDPVLALMLLTRDREALDTVAPIARRIATSPSLLREAAPELLAWLELGGDEKLPSLRGQLEHAMGAPRERIDGDEDALRATLAKRPGDQEVAHALAGLIYAEDPRGAHDLLRALGPTSALRGDARVMLAGTLELLGRPREAEAILKPIVALRLPRREAALAAYWLDVRREEVRGAAHDPALSERYAVEVVSRDHAVNAALLLGGLSLRSARSATGNERRRLLEQSEWAFLATTMVDEPEARLGLGELYHLLGRAQDGERELAAVLADPERALDVALAYRSLGMRSRMREVAEKVHAGARDAEVRSKAAALRAESTDDVAEVEVWMERAGASVFHRIHVHRAEAERLLDEGRWREADARLAAALEWSSARRPIDADAWNESAILLSARERPTGDPRWLGRAVKRFEQALALAPASPLVRGNLAAALERQVALRVLGRHLRIAELHLDWARVRMLMRSLLSGPDGQRVRAELRRDPALARALSLVRSVQKLTPDIALPYRYELELLGWTHDVAAMRRLVDRLDERRESGNDGAPPGQGEGGPSWYGDLARAEHPEPEGILDAASRGALLMLRGHGLLARATSAADCRAAADAFLESAPLWPAGDGRSAAGWALAWAAIHEAGEAAPSITALWDTGQLAMQADFFLERLARDPARVEAVRRQPALREAIDLLRHRAGARPRAAEWRLARIAGDAALEEQASAFDHEMLGLELDVWGHLDPATIEAAMEKLGEGGAP